MVRQTALGLLPGDGVPRNYCVPEVRMREVPVDLTIFTRKRRGLIRNQLSVRYVLYPHSDCTITPYDGGKLRLVPIHRCVIRYVQASIEFTEQEETAKREDNAAGKKWTHRLCSWTWLHGDVRHVWAVRRI